MDLVAIAKDFGLPLLGAIAGFISTSYAVRSDVRNLKTAVANATKGWSLQFRSHEKDIKEKLDALQKQVDEMEKSFHLFQRESSHSFASDEELSNFIEDQQRQWQAIQRTLGQIEGMLKRFP